MGKIAFGTLTYTLFLVVFSAVTLYSIIHTKGLLELERWNETVISNKNAMFFFVLMSLAFGGTYLSTRLPKKYKLPLYIITYTLVFSLGYIMSQAQPFRF